MNCKELKHQIKNQEITIREAENELNEIQGKLEATTKLQISLQEQCDKAFINSVGQTTEGAASGWAKGRAPGAIWGAAVGIVTSGGDSYEACLAADKQMEKVNELTERRNSAKKWVEEQRAILEELRDKLTNAGCNS